MRPIVIPAHAESDWFAGVPAWGAGRRWLALAIGALFVLFLLAAPVCWLCLPAVETSSSVPPPVWSWPAFREGVWQKGLEAWLKESSWVTYELRGVYEETRFRAGIVTEPRVVPGRDGWLFYAETLRSDPALVARCREQRRRVLDEVRAMAAALGAHLLAVPVPDKSTIYPEFTAPGTLPATRLGLYDAMLADLDEAGIPRVDVRAVLRAVKAAQPDVLLYLKRDTHWSLAAMQATAAAVRAAIAAQGFAGDFAVDPGARPTPVATRSCVPDLVRMLGMRVQRETFEHPLDLAELPAIVRELAEARQSLAVQFPGADGRLANLRVLDAAATVALCGTSYSAEGFTNVLAAELRTRIDSRGVLAGGGSFAGLRRVREAVQRGDLHPRLLVWEYVERDLQGDWVVLTTLDGR